MGFMVFLWLWFKSKLVSAAGLAPALPRFQAEHVAATPRAVDPGGLEPPGVWFLWRRFMWFPGTMTVGRSASAGAPRAARVSGGLHSVGNWRTRRELHPQPTR